MKGFLVFIVAGALCLLPVTGNAGSQSQLMNVSLTLGVPGGSVSLIVNPLVFAPPAQGGAEAIGSTTVQVTATAALSYQIQLNGGVNPGGCGRRMVAAADPFSVCYFLYQDAAYTQPWGASDANGPAAIGTGTGSAQEFTAWATTEGLFSPPPDGTYTDVVTVTVLF